MLTTLRELKRAAIYGTWRGQSASDGDRYSIFLAAPMDMPFLLRLAFEVLSAARTDRCREILVIPDGSRNDRGEALKKEIEFSGDQRTRYVEPGLRWRLLMPHVHNHPAMMALATESAQCRYAFVHDLDAFINNPNTIENMFDEIRERNMVAMGVTPRWDPAFIEMDLTIPGTWELFFDTCWLRTRPRQMVFGRSQNTPAGHVAFDSMLYPQFLEGRSGRVGVTQRPSSIVHFNGTVRTFRNFQNHGDKQVTDQLFRLALLSAIETVLSRSPGERVTPAFDELAKGLADANAPVRFDSKTNWRGYAEFRTMVEQMCHTAVFRGERANAIKQLFAVFDRHFDYDPDQTVVPALDTADVRASGLGQ